MKDVDDESFTERISRGTQAVSGCFKHCRSCSLASSTILDLIKEIEETFLEYKMHSAAAEQRELSKFGLWDKSQWAVMSKLAEAINQDVRIILKLVRDNARISESEKRDRDNTVKRLQVEMKNRISEFDMLKVENIGFRKEIERVTAEIETVRNRQSKTEQKNADLITELQETRGKMSHLAECNQIIQNQLVKVTDTKITLGKRIEKLRIEFDLAQEKNLELDKMKDSVTGLRDENESIKKEFECKIAKLESELELAMGSLASKNQNCRCSESDEKLTKTNSSSYSQEKSVVKPGDNPEADMTQQFDSNQRKIKELIRQNERLSKTLDRLREHRLRDIVKSEKGQ